MNNLKNKTVIPFKKPSTQEILISPKVLYTNGDRNNPRCERFNFMHVMHARLENDKEIEYTGGIAQIIEMKQDFVENKSCWGGDAVSVTITTNHPVHDVSLAFENGFIIQDESGKRWCNGKEFTQENFPELLPNDI